MDRKSSPAHLDALIIWETIRSDDEMDLRWGRLPRKRTIRSTVLSFRWIDYISRYRIRKKLRARCLTPIEKKRVEKVARGALADLERVAVTRRAKDMRERNAQKLERIAALGLVREKHPWIAELPLEFADSAWRVMLVFERVIGFVVLCVPRRIVDEESGDACEVLAEHFRRSSARWPAYLKLATTIFWIVIHTIGYAASQLRGSKKASGE